MHTTEEYLDRYLRAAGQAFQPDTPLFRTIPCRSGQLTERPMSRHEALRVVKRRVTAAGLSNRINCHTFRATGITVFLSSGGILENAQKIAGHESARTTKLYDRTNDEITLGEVERIRI